MFKVNVVTFLCLSFFIIANAKLVPYIDPCKWDDADCILKSSKKAVANMESLIENEMVVKEVNGDTGELKLKVKNLVVKKLSKCNIVEVKRPQKLKLVIKLDCPVDASGGYELGGKFFLLDVFGKGDLSIKTDDIRIEATANIEKVKGKDGKEHYKLKEFDYKFIPAKKVFFKFTNLYNGDETKAEPLYKIFDESWKEMLTEFGAPIIEAVVHRVLHVISEFMYRLPIEEFEITS